MLSSKKDPLYLTGLRNQKVPEGTMKLKFACPCGKRLLASLQKIGMEETCPRCSQSVQVPLFGMPSFLLYICSCGQESTEKMKACPKCHLAVPKELFSERDLSSFAVRVRKPSPHLKVKFQCDCGKRLLIYAHQAGKHQVCTHCKKVLTLPDYQDPSVLGLYCECSAELKPKVENCPSCHLAYFEAEKAEEVQIREVVLPQKEPKIVAPKKSEKAIQAPQLTPLHIFFAVGIPALIMGILALVLLSNKKESSSTEENTKTLLVKKDPLLEEKKENISEETLLANTTKEDKTTSEVSSPQTTLPQNPQNEMTPENPPMMGNEMGNGMGNEMATPKELDFNYFQAHIAPVMAKTCASTECHGGSEKTGKLKFQPADALGQFTELDLRANFDRIQPLVKPGFPRESRLFLKPLAVDLGGVEHGGGDVLTVGSKALNAFERFLSGDKLENLPPIASAGTDQEVELGAVVVLDGSNSQDPNEDSLSYSWTFASIPEGASDRFTNSDKVKAAFTAKVVGEYFVELTVSDSQFTSSPDKIKITVFSKAEVLAIESSKKQQEQGLTEEQINHRRYVRKVSLDTLNRPPTPSEYARFQNQSREQVVDQILASYEFWENWYEDELFYFLLIDNFRPANASLLALPARLHKKEMTTKDAIQAIAISQYFNARNPGNDTWVTVVFEQFLGMKVQDKKNVKHLVTGKKMYDGYKEKLFNREGRNQADVIDITLHQDSFYDLFLARHYERYFGEKPVLESIRSEIEQYKSDLGSYSQIVKNWLLSQKYVDTAWKLRPKSDFKFIRSLYIDLLGRRPTFEEYRLLRNGLQALADSRPLRSIMVKIIVESSQFQAPEKGTISDPSTWIRDQFLHYLCRVPTEQELDLWTKTFQNRFCSPKLMVQALMLNREYNSY